MAEKVCKHQFRLLDKKHSVDTGKNIYVFFCIKCLNLRRINTSTEGI